MIVAIAGDIIGGVPEAIWNRALGCLTCELGSVVVRFYERYRLPHWGETRASLPTPPGRAITAPPPRQRLRRRDLSPVAAAGGWS